MVTLRVLDFLRRIPGRPLLLITAVCLLLREEFPFSHFPMYSSFGRSTYYVYLTNGADQPLPTVTTLGVSTPTLKKIYESEVRREMERIPRASRKSLSLEQRRPAGERVLQRLLNSPRVQQSGNVLSAGLRLYEMRITLERREFQRRKELIAEL
ncbi:MAG: hypothetical protein M3Q89_10465 [Verrucomicrobiota bacterium]|nr:hypothetical protein [Verrucomicrobiota bacterium]